MKKGFYNILSITMASMLVFSGCGGKVPPSGMDNPSSQAIPVEKKTVLKLSSTLPTDDRSHAFLLKACDEIKEQSNGMLEIQFYPNAELGGLKDNMEQIVRGADIIAFADPGYISEFVPDIGILTGPYLFEHYSDIKKITSSEWYAELEKTASDKGIKLFSFNWYLGSRHYISDRAIKTPADFKGVKARTQSFPIAIETTKAMGANPISMAFSEVYTGLSQGTINASESPLSGIYNARWQEAVKHLSLTGHFVQIVPLSMSQKVFDELKPEYQTLLVETFSKYSEESNKAIEVSEEEWIQKFKNAGCEVIEVDKEAFRQACQGVYSTSSNWSPGLYERVKAIFAE